MTTYIYTAPGHEQPRRRRRGRRLFGFLLLLVIGFGSGVAQAENFDVRNVDFESIDWPEIDAEKIFRDTPFGRPKSEEDDPRAVVIFYGDDDQSSTTGEPLEVQPDFPIPQEAIEEWLEQTGHTGGVYVYRGQ